jgi:ring-1,2-phenylacetyl-CoA epoxidase subunit PaaC
VTGTGSLVDTTGFPPLARYCLRLGDDAFVFSHRLAEWITNAPQIEEDLALGNIGLDLLGQARALLTRAGELAAPAGTEALTEDDLIYWRDERLFTNVHLVEQPRGDFAGHPPRQHRQRRRRQSRQGGHLPPRPRHPVGAATR